MKKALENSVDKFSSAWLLHVCLTAHIAPTERRQIARISWFLRPPRDGGYPVTFRCTTLGSRLVRRIESRGTRGTRGIFSSGPIAGSASNVKNETRALVRLPEHLFARKRGQARLSNAGNLLTVAGPCDQSPFTLRGATPPACRACCYRDGEKSNARLLRVRASS